MCDEVIDVSLAALKLIPSKMTKKLYTALCVDENILHLNEDSGNVVFSCNEMDIFNIDLNNINLDSIILIRLLAWHIKFEKCKALKKR